jgi:hypothetical protein
MQITSDSLEAMGRRDENRMMLEVDRLARKIRQLLYDYKGRKFKKSPGQLRGGPGHPRGSQGVAQRQSLGSPGATLESPKGGHAAA